MKWTSRNSSSVPANTTGAGEGRVPAGYGRVSGARTETVVEGVRKEDSVSEQRLQQYRPGDEIEMVLHIQHAPMHLREVSARFFSKGQEEGGIISHMDLSGTPSISEDQPSHLQAPLQSEVRLSAKVAPDDAPGVYRLNRVTVKTYGGREHHYSAEELCEMGFEIDEEPDNRPVLQIEMGFRTDY